MAEVCKCKNCGGILIEEKDGWKHLSNKRCDEVVPVVTVVKCDLKGASYYVGGKRGIDQ